MDSSTLTAALERFADARILCIGDSMLDHTVRGKVERISPEAPSPIFAVNDTSYSLGGAANVLRNLVTLGATVHFITIVGDDDAGHRLTTMIGEQARTEASVLVDTQRPTTVKSRYFAQGQQIFRADTEEISPLSDTLEEHIIAQISALLPESDLVILSDYAKGVLTERIIRHAIDSARKADTPIIIDPKSANMTRYAGATLISPNLKELEAAARTPCSTDNAITEAAHILRDTHDFGAVLVTRGADGMSLIGGSGMALHIPARTREVYDVTGAGDSVIATLAIGMASRLPLTEAVELANIAGGIAVSRSGTTAVYRTEIATALHAQDSERARRKIRPLEVAGEIVESWRSEGLRVGFTNGCFDLLHTGHLSLMEQAKAACDRLIVGLNSDASVRRLKGPSRPVNDEISRAMVLAGLETVDMVVIFRDDTPLALLESLRPDVLVKGADYTLKEVVGADLIQSYGGTVILANLVEDKSTTQTVARITSSSTH